EELWRKLMLRPQSAVGVAIGRDVENANLRADCGRSSQLRGDAAAGVQAAARVRGHGASVDVHIDPLLRSPSGTTANLVPSVLREDGKNRAAGNEQVGSRTAVRGRQQEGRNELPVGGDLTFRNTPFPQAPKQIAIERPQ